MSVSNFYFSVYDLECFVTSNGEDYRGSIATTTGTSNSTAAECMHWYDVGLFSVKYPELSGHNYCRNPGGGDVKPWCFTEYTNGTWEWDYCDIGAPWTVDGKPSNLIRINPTKLCKAVMVLVEWTQM